MSEITKKALAETLKKLLSKNKLNKITIKEITEDCGINRQTFYYHFKDIYDLLEWIYKNEVIQEIEEKTTYETWQYIKKQRICKKYILFYKQRLFIKFYI